MQRIFPRFLATPSLPEPKYTVRKSRVRPATQLDYLRSIFLQRVVRLIKSHHRPHHRSRHSPHSFDLFRQGHATPNECLRFAPKRRSAGCRNDVGLLPDYRRATGGLPPDAFQCAAGRSILLPDCRDRRSGSGGRHRGASCRVERPGQSARSQVVPELVAKW